MGMGRKPGFEHPKGKGFCALGFGFFSMDLGGFGGGGEVLARGFWGTATE